MVQLKPCSICKRMIKTDTNNKNAAIISLIVDNSKNQLELICDGCFSVLQFEITNQITAKQSNYNEIYS